MEPVVASILTQAGGAERVLSFVGFLVLIAAFRHAAYAVFSSLRPCEVEQEA